MSYSEHSQINAKPDSEFNKWTLRAIDKDVDFRADNKVFEDETYGQMCQPFYDESLVFHVLAEFEARIEEMDSI